MSESSESQRRPDPADALADMAAEQPQEAATPEDSDAPADPLAALNEMASQPGDSAAELDALSAARPEEDAGVVELTEAAGPADFQARRTLAAALDSAQGRARAHAYRKTMIPFLVVVAGLLILVGILSAVMVLGSDQQHRASSRWCFYMSVVTLVSFPLAAVLAFGAWWFHREVKDT